MCIIHVKLHVNAVVYNYLAVALHVLFSQLQLITEAGSTAAKRLSEELRGEIVMRDRMNLGKTRDYFRGLKSIRVKYRYFLQYSAVSICCMSYDTLTETVCNKLQQYQTSLCI